MPADPEPIVAELETLTKPWWQSRTIIGAVAALVAEVLKASGIVIGTEDLTTAILGGIQIVGIIVAIVGRVKATHTLSK